MMKESQTTSRVFLVRPATFEFNAETAGTNSFQGPSGDLDLTVLRERALGEFDGLVAALRDHEVDVFVYADEPRPATPDALFPNNWISLHADGRVVLYPLLAPNRRAEVHRGLVDELQKDLGAVWPRCVDLTPLAEAEPAAFLEGTGSVVLDRPRRIAYACWSPRTTAAGLEAFASAMGYEIVAFRADDAGGAAIYHTNVMLSIGERFAAVCLECMPEPSDRELVRKRLEETGHEVVALTLEQRDRFAGNMLAIENRRGQALIVLSRQAHASLAPPQLAILERHGRIVSAPLETIESVGGGSARCMLAEIHVPSD